MENVYDRHGQIVGFKWSTGGEGGPLGHPGQRTALSEVTSHYYNWGARGGVGVSVYFEAGLAGDGDPNTAAPHIAAGTPKVHAAAPD